LGSAAMVALRAETWVLMPADWAALRFTVVQAAFSAGISTLLAIPVARALHRRRFWGRLGLIRVMAAPFVLPAVVAVLGWAARASSIVCEKVTIFQRLQFGIWRCKINRSDFR